MNKPIHVQNNLDSIISPNTIETFISDELPLLDLCVSVYGFVFKNGKFLQTDLREGERPTRRLDIPGGHIDHGETPEQAIIREIYEETGIRAKVAQMVGFCKVTVQAPKPDNYKYPYPTSFMVFYLCEVLEEEIFEGNESAHGRVWLDPKDFDSSEWARENKTFLEKVISIKSA